MKYLPATIAFLLIFGATLFAQESPFQVKVSGLLASRLAPDTQLHFWSLFSKTSRTFAIGELPVVLPFDKFNGHQWHIVFSSKSTRSSFSVSLSDELFEEPRVIDVKLDAPCPSIRPIFSLLGRDVRYTASITQRMEYRDLPYWDGKRQCLTQAPTPEMTIVSLQDGKMIHDKKMTESCMASKWYAFIDRDIKLTEGGTYRMSVEYDSGGLFPAVTTRYDFTYHSALHGD